MDLSWNYFDLTNSFIPISDNYFIFTINFENDELIINIGETKNISEEDFLKFYKNYSIDYF